MNNQISNNTVLKTQINSRSKRAKRFRRKRERKSSKRESESSSSDNPIPLITNPINRRSRISMSYHIPCLLRCLHLGFLWSLDGERDRRIVRWREIGFRLHHRYRVASPRFPPESRGEFGSVAWFRGGWGTWRVIEGVRARFNPSPTANFHGLWARKSTRGRNYRTNLI